MRTYSEYEIGWALYWIDFMQTLRPRPNEIIMKPEAVFIPWLRMWIAVAENAKESILAGIDNYKYNDRD